MERLLDSLEVDHTLKLDISLPRAYLIAMKLWKVNGQINLLFELGCLRTAEYVENKSRIWTGTTEFRSAILGRKGFLS